jgi:outer membrane biosynthesis protein TonB
VSEELENSLQQSIETYVNERLRGIDDQLARLQTEFNEAFARLRESTASGQMETPVSSAITAHLQAAREQKLSGSSSVAAPSPDFSLIKSAFDEIRSQQTQTDILGALLRNAVNFADRVALFVVKGDQAIGWRSCDVQDRSQLNTIPGTSLPLSGNTVVSQAARSGEVESASGTSAEDGGLIEKLGGEPQQLAAVPLVIRSRTVAVLYADSAWPHRDAIQSDALEILARVAGMSIALLSPARAAQPQPSASVAQPAAPAPPEPEAAPEPEQAPETVAVEAQPAEPEYAPQVETQTAEERAAPIEAEAPPVQEPPAPVEPEAVAEAEAPTAAEPMPPPPVETPSEAPAFAQQYSAPLGSVRRWGVAEPELPIEVGEDERRLHNDARRFARLLVSEIKLYNEQKVNEGRSQGNIYERLRDDIDRSRQMYDKRVAPPVAARHDYFHQELVNTLAEGDPSKLGNSYPGAAVAAN